MEPYKHLKAFKEKLNNSNFFQPCVWNIRMLQFNGNWVIFENHFLNVFGADNINPYEYCYISKNYSFDLRLF